MTFAGHPPAKVAIGWIVFIASLGFAMIQLDVTVVNVALPRMGADLHTGTAGLQWVVDAYAVAFAALLLSAGALGDRWGADRAYGAGFIVFAAASLGCALSPTAPVLIGFRAVQGAGAALMLPTSLAVLNHECHSDPALRARSIGTWTAVGGTAIAAGPVIGGLLIHLASWRCIFYVNLPISALGWVLNARMVPPTPRKLGRSFDLAGQVLAVVALAGLTAGVIEARPLGPRSPVVIGPLVIGLAAAAAFVRTEAGHAEPMLPLRFFRLPSFSPAVVFGLFINLTYYGVVFVLSLYLQRTLGYSALRAGLAYLPLTATFVAANIASGRLVARRGSRWPMVVGAAIGAVGFSLLLPLGAHSRYAAMLAPFLLIPIGMGLAVPAMTTAILASVDRHSAGVASGVLNAARQAGGAMGVAIFGALAGGATAHIVPGLKLSAAVSVVLLAVSAVLAAAGVRRSV
jgi:DHA2 family methylenomycin A resistance protein-like MFS transporter